MSEDVRMCQKMARVPVLTMPAIYELYYVSSICFFHYLFWNKYQEDYYDILMHDDWWWVFHDNLSRAFVDAQKHKVKQRWLVVGTGRILSEVLCTCTEHQAEMHKYHIPAAPEKDICKNSMEQWIRVYASPTTSNYTYVIPVVRIVSSVLLS